MDIERGGGKKPKRYNSKTRQSVQSRGYHFAGR